MLELLPKMFGREIEYKRYPKLILIAASFYLPNCTKYYCEQNQFQWSLSKVSDILFLGL